MIEGKREKKSFSQIAKEFNLEYNTNVLNKHNVFSWKQGVGSIRRKNLIRCYMKSEHCGLRKYGQKGSLRIDSKLQYLTLCRFLNLKLLEKSIITRYFDSYSIQLENLRMC